MKNIQGVLIKFTISKYMRSVAENVKYLATLCTTDERSSFPRQTIQLSLEVATFNDNFLASHSIQLPLIIGIVLHLKLLAQFYPLIPNNLWNFFSAFNPRHRLSFHQQ